MIAFRLDGGPGIGVGHVMRCLSLAAALRERGEVCTFLTADETMADTIRGAGFALYVLHTDRRDFDAELDTLVPLLGMLQPTFLVADSYAVTPRWMTCVRGLQPLYYIDDEDAFLYPADAVINYNLSGLLRDYPGKYPGLLARNALLLGPRYAPLRAEFAGLPRRVVGPDSMVRNVLISTGGADPENIAQRLMALVAATPRWAGVRFHLVVGALNPHLDALHRAAAARPNLEIHTGVTRMSALMLGCDIALAAAGSTLYELCACGTPTVTYTLADNQRPGAEAFAARGLMLNAGDCRGTAGPFEARVADCLETLLQSPARRAAMAAAMQELVDGNGAARLADALLRLAAAPSA